MGAGSAGIARSPLSNAGFVRTSFSQRTRTTPEMGAGTVYHCTHSQVRRTMGSAFKTVNVAGVSFHGGNYLIRQDAA